VIAAVPPQQTPGAGDCSSLITPSRAIEHAFKLPGGQRAVLRDPYGGLVFRNRLFVQFSVKSGDSAQRSRLIDHVEWRLDGDATALGRNGGGPYALRIPSTRLAAGEHSLTAHVALRDGSAVDKTTDLRVSDCQPVTFFGDVLGHRGATLSVGSGGPSLRGVGFTAVRGVRVTIPRAARGRTVGTLSFFDGTFPYRAQAPKALTLRAPRRGGVLLRRGSMTVTFRPGRRDFLLVTGLPANTRGVRLLLKRRVVRASRPCPVRTTVRATVLGADGGAAALDSGSRC
jgi:hypothetical protein